MDRAEREGRRALPRPGRRRGLQPRPGPPLAAEPRGRPDALSTCRRVAAGRSGRGPGGAFERVSFPGGRGRSRRRPGGSSGAGLAVGRVGGAAGRTNGARREPPPGLHARAAGAGRGRARCSGTPIAGLRACGPGAAALGGGLRRRGRIVRRGDERCASSASGSRSRSAGCRGCSAVAETPAAGARGPGRDACAIVERCSTRAGARGAAGDEAQLSLGSRRAVSLADHDTRRTDHAGPHGGHEGAGRGADEHAAHGQGRAHEQADRQARRRSTTPRPRGCCRAS